MQANPEKSFEISMELDGEQLDEDLNLSKKETHFDIPWKFISGFEDDHLMLDIKCLKLCEEEKIWLIIAEVEFSLTSKNGTTWRVQEKCYFGNDEKYDTGERWGWSRFMHFKTIEEDVLIHGNPTLSVRVNILETRGCGKEKLRDFDESAQEFSDVVILVKDQKFYLNKKFLAFQSSYFKSLLLGNFEESQKTEIKLEGIDPEDFQNFLELIHGESAIEDINVAGILRLADIYDSPVAIRRCAEFLEKTNLDMFYKLQLKKKYRLPGLEKKS